MEQLLSVFLGIGLAAASGFRVFVPLLVSNVASLLGYYHFSDSMQWMGSYSALAIFGTATLVEIGAYYIPWLDNALDTIAMPLSILAGTVLATSVVDMQNPALKWALGLLLGGGTAGIIQAGTSSLRLLSSGSTGGVANPILASVENVLSIFTAIFSFFFPVLIVVIIFILIIFLFRRKKKKATLPS